MAQLYEVDCGCVVLQTCAWQFCLNMFCKDVIVSVAGVTTLTQLVFSPNKWYVIALYFPVHEFSSVWVHCAGNALAVVLNAFAGCCAMFTFDKLRVRSKTVLMWKN